MKKSILIIISLIVLMLFVSITTADVYTTSLLHYDEVGGSTIFTDENPLNIWTAHNALTINGENDPIWLNNTDFGGTKYIDSQPSTSFVLSNHNWTFDTRIRYDDSYGASQRIMGMGKYAASGGYKSAKLHTAKILGVDALQISFYSDHVTMGEYYHILAPGEFNINQWYHLQIARCGADATGYAKMLLFIDGVMYEMPAVADMPANTNLGDMKNMTLGTNDFSHFPNLYLYGSLDETRFSNKICRNTESFTPPAYPYESSPAETYYSLSISKAPIVVVSCFFVLLIGIILYAYSQKRRTNV